MDMEKWAKRNLAIMWFANFFIGGSITMVMPFISLYIETFGDFPSSYVQNWSGLTVGITFVTAFIFSPIWGKIGDRYGRKKILLFTSTGMGLCIFIMGLVSNVWQLFLLRFFMGVFTGFVSISQAYISTQTPRQIAGRVLGTLQTGTITGQLVGPLLGGVLADAIGYASTFKCTSIAVLMSALFVSMSKEFKLADDKKESKKLYTSKEVFAHLASHPVLLNVLLISMLIQIAHFSIQPILSLYVSEIHGPENLSLYSGIAFSAAGLGNLLTAKQWGKLADRLGYTRILVILLFSAGLSYLPGALVTNIWQLVFIRFLLGIFIGGIIPVRIAYIRQEAPIAMQGEVLGYNTSLRFLGNVIGPVLGGFISGMFGFPAVFYMTSELLFISGMILLWAIKKQQSKIRGQA